MDKEDKEEQVSEEEFSEEESIEEDTTKSEEELTQEEASEEQTSDEIEKLLQEEPAEETIAAEEEITPKEEKKARFWQRRQKEDEQEFVEERIYTIPLGKALVRPHKKRAPRAMQLIRNFITKHMKMDMRPEVEEERGEMPRLIITNDVNEKVWDRSIEKPPRKIRVRAAKDNEGNVTVFLAEGD